MSAKISNAVPSGYSLSKDGKTLGKAITNNKELRLIYGPDPRTKEMARKYFPFFVSLPIRESVLLGVGRRHGVFTHAQNAQQATTIAGKFWDHHFRQLTGKNGKDDYPKLVHTEFDDPSTAGLAAKLDDDDFDQLWKEATNLPHVYAGEPTAPITFMLTTQKDLMADADFKTRHQPNQ